MSKERGLQIPLAALSGEVKGNDFALLRIMVDVFGKVNAKVILKLLEDDHEIVMKFANDIIFASLRERFVVFEGMNESQIKRILLGYYETANDIIKNLLTTSYPGMELQVGTLNTTDIPMTDLAKRISILCSNGESTDRYKYELLRQDLLALMLLELDKYKHVVENGQKLIDIMYLFEDEIFIGKVGKINPQTVYSVHCNDTNQCYGTYHSNELAKEAVLANDRSDITHVKQHNWEVRDVDGIGGVLTEMRLKTDFSIIRKVISHSIKDSEKGLSTKIELGLEKDLYDTTGFMFVVPNGNQQNMLVKLLQSITTRYPEATVMEKHKVPVTDDIGRGRSNNVSFLRVMLKFDEETSPVEVMIMDQVEYMNYRFDLEQAHALFSIRKSVASAGLLFPDTIYDIDEDEVESYRISNYRDIQRELLEANRVIV